MEFSKEEIEKLTHLCRIKCTEEEKRKLHANLKKILNYVEELSTLDLQDVPPCNHILPQLKNILREDVCEQTLSQEEFLNNSPASISSMIRVPPVIEKGGGDGP